MFNSTHTLAALAIARTGPEKWARHASLTAVIASNLPDVDSIAGLWGTAVYLEHHRGITHSLIGVPILAALLAVVVSFFNGSFFRTYAVALIAMATHPALDYLNPYGLRPFLPWNNTWYYGDLVFIIDPYLDLALLSGVVAGTFRPNIRRAAAWGTFAIAFAYVGVRVELHSKAVSQLEQSLARSEVHVEKIAVIPQMNPLLWQGTFKTRFQVTTLSIEALADGLDPFSAVSQSQAFHLDAATPEPVAKAARTGSAGALLRFARFPVQHVLQTRNGFVVTFWDFRFRRGASSLAAEVGLDNSLNVTHESLSFLHAIP